jgi:RNA polymerase sigma factor (sigma-70 family)
VMWPERSPETNAASRSSALGRSDECLVEAAKRGHSTAFATLSERYRLQLFRAALRITRSCEDAEDAVQDTLLRGFVHIRDFDGRSSFGTWLTRIAINSSLMILRKKRAAREIAMDCNDDLDADGPRYEMTDHRPSPESRYVQSEEESMLKRAVQKLRPTLRVVLQIQQLQERSMWETAEAIGISLAAAKGRLFHAKKALRRSMIAKLVRKPRFAERDSRFAPKAMAQRKYSSAQMEGALQQQSGDKEEGDECVIKTKEKRKYRAPSNLHPGRDRRGFSKELVA